MPVLLKGKTQWHAKIRWGRMRTQRRLPERREFYALQRIRGESRVSCLLGSAIRAHVAVATASAGICRARSANFLRAKFRGRRREQTHHVAQALLLVRLRHADHRAERVRIRVIA